MLTEILARNDVALGDIISASSTATPDLTSVFPAAAAREIGFGDILSSALLRSRYRARRRTAFE
jgi:chorismate mutase